MSTRRASAGTAVIAGLLALTGSFYLPPTAASAVPGTPCAAGTPVAGDYDGDGRADLAVNVERSIGSETDWPFAVTPADAGQRAWLTGPTRDPELVNADLNGDSCGDAVLNATTLVLGTPDGLDMAGATMLTLPQASLPQPGEVLELTATALRHDGLSQVAVAGWVYDQEEGCCEAGHFLDIFTLDASGAPGAAQVLDLTSRKVAGVLALASSGRTVAVGAGDLAAAGKARAGGVLMFSATSADPANLTYRTTLTQNSPGIPGTAEAEDGFGAALSFRDGRLAVGAPGESIGRAVYAGVVQPLLWREATSTWTAYRAISQGTAGVVGTNEAGDQFGYVVVVTRGLTAAGSYDIAIGATEKVGKASAGSVTVANFSKAAYRTLTQNSSGVPGTAETGDDFGAGLGVLRTSKTTDTLLIGAPGERRALPSPEFGYVVRSDGRRLTSSTNWKPVPAFEDFDRTTYRFWGSRFAR